MKPLLLSLLAVLAALILGSSAFLVGSGINDITGPAAEWGMMGYAMPDQITHGIHFRLRARAFVFVDENTGKRVAFVNLDSAMCFQSVKMTVVDRLTAMFGDLYISDNVMISGIHTHAGPGGFAWDNLYEITTMGFSKANFNVIVNGIVMAIIEAHKNLKPAWLYLNQDILLDSNINRSPWAYLNNPAEERAKYTYDVDKLMTAVKIVGLDKSEIGLLNFFSVHGTSMNNKNLLISGDNKGVAAYLFEKHKNPDSLPGHGPFVAVFAQSNEGDVSPNTRGAFCPDGSPCDFEHSTCGGKTQGCNGIGPGQSDTESCYIIGNNQFKKALDLYNSAKQLLSGPVDYIHMHVNMTDVTVLPEFSSTKKQERTCPAAVGDAFAAGTTDGPGAFDFTQGDPDHPNVFWNWLATFITGKPSEQQVKCHAPKPILLNVGEARGPSPWVPSILPIQIFRLGSLAILGVPAEFSTMSGRRLRDTVQTVFEQNGLKNMTVVIAGLSNAYSQYVTTYEEYQRQRYEGGSTLYGPHTLAAYQQNFAVIAKAMALGQKVNPGPNPPNLSEYAWSFHLPVVLDEHPAGVKFGAVEVDVRKNYTLGDTVSVTFVSANPQNDLKTQSTFLSVERQNPKTGVWTVVCDDGCWETKFKWARVHMAESRVTVLWEVTAAAEPGVYRIQHFGNAKNIIGGITPFTGTSSSFTVTNPSFSASKHRPVLHGMRRVA